MTIKNIEFSKEVLLIREAAMYPGQGIEITRVEGDENAVHFGIFKEEKLIGVASLFDSQIRKVAILPEYQRQGLGSTLMKFIMMNQNYYFLNARINKTSFYEKLGFYVVKDTNFKKNGIEYIKMEFKKNH